MPVQIRPRAPLHSVGTGSQSEDVRISERSSAAVRSFSRGSKTRVRQTSNGSQPPDSGPFFAAAGSPGDGCSANLRSGVNRSELACSAAVGLLILCRDRSLCSLFFEDAQYPRAV